MTKDIHNCFEKSIGSVWKNSQRVLLCQHSSLERQSHLPGYCHHRSACNVKIKTSYTRTCTCIILYPQAPVGNDLCATTHNITLINKCMTVQATLTVQHYAFYIQCEYTCNTYTPPRCTSLLRLGCRSTGPIEILQQWPRQSSDWNQRVAQWPECLAFPWGEQDDDQSCPISSPTADYQWDCQWSKHWRGSPPYYLQWHNY